jgi:hypothetical protein
MATIELFFGLSGLIIGLASLWLNFLRLKKEKQDDEEIELLHEIRNDLIDYLKKK